MQQFRASFVQSHRPVIHSESVQKFDSRIAFSRMCHLDEGESARSPAVTVLHNGDRFN